MTIAVYARQSVLKEDSLSIETQVETCRAKISITFSNAKVVVFENRGFSGKNTNRPQFQELLEEIEQDKIDKLVTYKFDRISRNIVDFYNFHSFLKKHKCSLISCKDDIDTDSKIGDLLMGILINFAQMERENIQMRVQDSYYARAETDGRFLGGRAPFGYDLAKNENGVSTLIPNEEMEIVELLFTKYAFDSNCSLHQLVRFLHEEKGIVKSARAIKIILSNPIYVKADEKLYNYYKALGVQFLNQKEDWNGINACQVLNKTDQSENKSVMKSKDEWKVFITNWEGVIDSRTFLMCQERLNENVALSKDTTPQGKFKELSGLVKCKRCGRGVKIKGKYGSMSCIGRSELRGVCDISFRGVRLEMLQEQVAREIQVYLDNYKRNQDDWITEKRRLQNAAKKIEEEIDNLVNAIAEKPHIKSYAKGIEQREKMLADIQYKMQMDVSTSSKIEYRVLKIFQRINPPHDLIAKMKYTDLPVEEKQALLRILVDRILIDENGKVEIVWKK